MVQHLGRLGRSSTGTSLEEARLRYLINGGAALTGSEEVQPGPSPAIAFLQATDQSFGQFGSTECLEELHPA
jgi:hypothetical protein